MSASAIAFSKPVVLRAWHMFVVIVVLLLAAVAVFSKHERRIEVAVKTIGYEDIEATVSATGTVVPINDYPVRANFTGLVDKIYVRLGQKVRSGDPLVHMKDQYAVPRLENARAALLASQVANENVEHNGSREDRIGLAVDLEHARNEQASAASALTTLKQLEANGSASEAEVAASSQRLDAANATLKSLEERTTSRYSAADIESWKARVAAEAAALQAEKVSYSNSNLTSPISGTVYILPVTLYDFVPAGGDMLHIADFSRLRINADFYEADVVRLRVGQKVRVTWDGSPHQSWQGKLVARPFALSGSGPFRTGHSVIDLSDQAADLPVNTNVTVVVTTEMHPHVLAISRDALQSDGAGRFVYRVVDGHLKRTPVQVGIVNAMQAEITEGLKPDDVVAVHSFNDGKMMDGILVNTNGNG